MMALRAITRDERTVTRPQAVNLVNEFDTLEEFAYEVLSMLDIQACEPCNMDGLLERGPLVAGDGETYLCAECAQTWQDGEEDL